MTKPEFESTTISVLQGLQNICDNLNERVSALLGRVYELEIKVNELKDEDKYTRDDIYSIQTDISKLKNKLEQ